MLLTLICPFPRRTIGDEYQRTVGAFFSIYWLMRLSHDGRLGFCFGVDEQYRPIRSDAGDERLYPAEKRLKFYSESQWEQFDQLLFDAGLLVKDSVSVGRASRSPARRGRVVGRSGDLVAGVRRSGGRAVGRAVVGRRTGGVARPRSVRRPADRAAVGRSVLVSFKAGHGLSLSVGEGGCSVASARGRAHPARLGCTECRA